MGDIREPLMVRVPSPSTRNPARRAYVGRCPFRQRCAESKLLAEPADHTKLPRSAGSSESATCSKVLPALEDVAIEVRGCTGELVGCNGMYEYTRAHKGKAMFVHTNGKQGVFHWVPSRDGGLWTLNGKNISPDAGYHFSQTPLGTNHTLPPTGHWLHQRFDSNSGSEYPEISVIMKNSQTDVEFYVIEVSGCTGDMTECNGSYKFDRMHNGKPLFLHTHKKGILHWVSRDGGIWALNGQDSSPARYNFSQWPSAKSMLPPAGLWEHERLESSGDSAYPRLTVTKKSTQSPSKLHDVGVEVSGCTGEMACCNGLYIFDRMHKEKPLFLSTSGIGVLHWNPRKGGGVWVLNGKSTKPEAGYHFSQSPNFANPGLPPAGPWRIQRVETSVGSDYPLISIVSRIQRAMDEAESTVIEVAGCTAELAQFNGYYEFDGMQNGRPLFVNCTGSKGMLYWSPERDGGVWALNARNVKPDEQMFSQKPDGSASLPPVGQWKCERWDSSTGCYPKVNIVSKIPTKVVPQRRVRARPLQSPGIPRSKSPGSSRRDSRCGSVSSSKPCGRSDGESKIQARGSRTEESSSMLRICRSAEVSRPASSDRFEWELSSPSLGCRSEWQLMRARPKGARHLETARRVR